MAAFLLLVYSIPPKYDWNKDCFDAFFKLLKTSNLIAYYCYKERLLDLLLIWLPSFILIWKVELIKKITPFIMMIVEFLLRRIKMLILLQTIFYNLEKWKGRESLHCGHLLEEQMETVAFCYSFFWKMWMETFVSLPFEVFSV